MKPSLWYNMIMNENTTMDGYCECGCGQKTTVSTHNNKHKGYITGVPRRFVQGHHSRVQHPMLGRQHTDEAKAKISASQLGQPGRFTGKAHSTESKARMSESKAGIKLGPQPGKYVEDPGYMAVHNWMRRHYPKTGFCEVCGEEKLTYWSNISGDYHRLREDFWELCVPCHKIFDYILAIDLFDPKRLAIMYAKRDTKDD